LKTCCISRGAGEHFDVGLDRVERPGSNLTPFDDVTWLEGIDVRCRRWENQQKRDGNNTPPIIFFSFAIGLHADVFGNKPHVGEQ
jgi:hypothetical protein